MIVRCLQFLRIVERRRGFAEQRNGLSGVCPEIASRSGEGCKRRDKRRQAATAKPNLTGHRNRQVKRRHDDSASHTGRPCASYSWATAARDFTPPRIPPGSRGTLRSRISLRCRRVPPGYPRHPGTGGSATSAGCAEIVGIRFRTGLFAGGNRIRTVGPLETRWSVGRLCRRISQHRR
jgi:hypothetical protein